jgi:biopolymer transport protein ExbD
MQLHTRRSTRHAVLDMTPLIDVVFLLLIFFMVSTTFERETQLKIDLPEASGEAVEARPDERIEITIDQAGLIYVNQRELVTSDLPTLRRALAQLAADDLERVVLVDADERAPFQAVVIVMDAASQLGLSKVRFMAHRDEAAAVTPTGISPQ